MFESIILWLIIGTAAIYCGRRAYLTLSGKSKGCCGDCETSKPTPQQIIPDISDNIKENGKDK